MRHDRRRTWQALAAAMAGLLCCGFAAGKVPCGYDVEIVAQDCGIFHEDTEGLGLAPSGLVVGAFPDCQDGKPFYHAFLWPPPPGGAMQVVPLRAGGPDVYSMELFDANDAGQSVGTLKEFDGYNFEAFMLDHGRVIPLGVLPGAIASEALAVNAHGVAVGWSGFSSRLPRRAVLWEPDGRIIDMGADLGTRESEATDVSDSGLVTGWMGSFLFDTAPFVWDAGKVIELPLLPELGTVSTDCNAINDLGNCCGFGLIANPDFSYSGSAYAYIDGRAVSLGALPGYEGSWATDINIHNQIVGGCSGGGPITAFVWEDGIMYALNDLINPKISLNVSYVHAISDSGVIIGQASMPGGGYAVRLIPRSPADFDCDGDVEGTELGILLGQWGKCPENLSCSADLNSDGVVNGFDLAMLLGDWG